MMTITVEINGRIIGQARIGNISDLADISDYKVHTASSPSTLTGAPALQHEFEIRGHKRKQSPWALVEKVAAHAAARDNYQIDNPPENPTARDKLLEKLKEGKAAPTPEPAPRRPPRSRRSENTAVGAGVPENIPMDLIYAGY